MKTLRIVVLLVAMAFSLTGCDFFRSIMGRPTSAEMEQIRIEAQKKAEREKFVADSIKAAQEAARQAALVQEIPTVNNDDPRYHVIIGCFKVKDNAVNLRDALKRDGLNPKKIMFRNGFDAVSIFQSDDWWQARQKLNAFRSSPYCPDDVWIYDMNEKLHE